GASCCRPPTCCTQSANLIFFYRSSAILQKQVPTLPHLARLVSWQHATTTLRRCWLSARRPLPEVSPRNGMRFLRSVYRPIAQSLRQSIGAWSIRLCALRAPLTNATLHLPMRSGGCRLPRRLVAIPPNGLALVMTGNAWCQTRSITLKWVLRRSVLYFESTLGPTS